MKDFAIGQQASITRCFTLEDLAEYAALTGDATPGAPPTIPGPLIGGLFSFLLGTQLPGPGTNYLKQRLHFLAPARPGAALTATVAITRLRPEKALVNLSTICTDADGRTICTGEALVLALDV